MSKFDEQYLDLCERILENGEKVSNDPKVADKKLKENAGTNFPNHLSQTLNPIVTYRLPHQTLQFNLAEEFPILTTKYVAWKAAIIEMFWIFQAQSNDVRWLQERGVKIWNEWKIDENGDYLGKHFGSEFAHTIGTAYGWIVNRYKLTQGLIETLKNDPNNRRMVISLWQNEFLPTAALPSCVWNSQWNVTNGRLNVLVASRSTDVPLGLPFNITQYAAFCHLLAQVCDLEPGLMTFVTNDAHIYENQIDGIKEQLRRRDEKLATDGKLFDAPKLWVNPDIKDFFKFDNSKELLDVRLENYEHQGKISMSVAM
ncbi:thymidylate synthase [Candidatus Saccharibacteria bacterium]|nr:thymidylate synthase [Candidatus Saccharibacteria bacterium]